MTIHGVSSMVEQLSIFQVYEEPVHEERESKLSPRHWALYRLIKSNSEAGLETTQEEICSVIDGFNYNDSEKVHDHCPTIWTAIKDINLSNEVEKIIIYKDFKAHLAHSQEELDEYLDDKWNELAPRLVRYWFLKKKASMDGQGKLLSDQLRPIDDDSRARAFVESFLRI